MSLQIWLPLTKDLRQQGLSNLTVTNTGVTYSSTGGKLGGCYNFDGTKYLQSNETIGEGVKELTFACWICPGSETLTSGQWYRILGIGPHTRAQLDISSDNRFRLFVGQTGSTSGLGATSTTVLQADVWYHICGVLGNNYMAFYVNGNREVYNTIDSSSITYTNADYFRVGTINSGNLFRGKLNDVRYYNHALSSMEVKELSKGLVLHYPLCNQYETGQVNKYSSPYSDGECSSSSFTKTKLTNERGYNYKLTRTGDGTNSWPSWNVPNYSFTAGKTYYYSVKIRCNKWTSGNLVLRASRSNNDWVTNGVTICSPALADGKWHEYYTYQTVNADYDRSGTTVTSNPVLEFYCSNQNGNGTVYDMDFDVKDVQVIESDCYVPFIENSFVGTTIYDCSGLGNNGTRTGTFSLTSDTPKYSMSQVFASGNNYIDCGASQEVLPTDGLTVSLWINYSTWGNPISCTEGGGWNFENSSGIQFPVYVASVGYKVANSGVATSTLQNGWHMLTGTFDKTNVKIYIDGILKATTATGSTNGIGYATNHCYVGAEAAGSTSIASAALVGKLSDVRIYATALSADDVKSLYQNSAYIDSSGNVYGAVHSEV